MNAANGKSLGNERILWHGTSRKTVKVICQRGFNRSYCGIHGTLLYVITAALSIYCKA